MDTFAQAAGYVQPVVGFAAKLGSTISLWMLLVMTDKYLLGIPLLEGSLWRSPGRLSSQAGHGKEQISGSKSGRRPTVKNHGLVHEDAKPFEPSPVDNGVNFTTPYFQPSHVSPFPSNSLAIGTSSTTALSLYQPLEVHDPFGPSSRFSELGYLGIITFLVLVMLAFLSYITNRCWYPFGKSQIRQANNSNLTPTSDHLVRLGLTETTGSLICWESTLEELGLVYPTRVLEDSLERLRALKKVNESLSEAAGAEKMLAQSAEEARKDAKVKAEKAEKAKEDLEKQVKDIEKAKNEKDLKVKKIEEEKNEQREKIARIEKEKNEQEGKVKSIEKEKNEAEEKMKKIEKERNDQEKKMKRLEKDQKEKMKKMGDEKKDLEEKIEEIKNAKKKVEEKIKAKNTKIMSQRSKIEALEEQTSSLGEELAEQKASAITDKEEIATYKSQIADLSSELGRKNTEIEASNVATSTPLAANITSLDQTLSQAQSRIREPKDVVEQPLSSARNVELAEVEKEVRKEGAKGSVQDDVKDVPLGVQRGLGASQYNRKKLRSNKRADKSIYTAKHPQCAPSQQRKTDGQQTAKEKGALDGQLHSEAQKDVNFSSSKQARRLCPYFAKGTCIYGAGCYDAHELPANSANSSEPLEESSLQVPSPAADQHRPCGPFDPKPGRPVCSFFTRGYCKFGAGCRDHHDLSRGSANPRR